MSIQDEYSKRIDWYDQAVWVARQREQRALRWADQHRPELAEMHRESDDYQSKVNVQAMIEHHARCEVTAERLAVIEADAARERAMQAWEREMDDEDARDKYGLIPVPRKEMTARNHDNVIRVDFATRTRAPRTARPWTGR